MENLLLTFFKKLNTFNDIYSPQCQPISNDGIFLLILTYYTGNILHDINFNYGKILKSLDPNKAHGHDGVSIRMLRISCPSSN